MKSITSLIKIIFIFSTTLLLLSCSKQQKLDGQEDVKLEENLIKQPKCDSDEAIKLAKDLIKQQLNSKSNSMAFAMLGMGNESTIEKFVDENIEIINVRPTAKFDGLKKCDCASQITFKFSKEFEAKMKENEGKNNIILSAVNEILTKQIDFAYTLQIIEKENNLFIEGIVPEEELKGVLTNYIIFSTTAK